MDTRYDLLKNAFCKNLKEYNKKFTERKLNPESVHRYRPYIVPVSYTHLDVYKRQKLESQPKSSWRNAR